MTPWRTSRGRAGSGNETSSAFDTELACALEQRRAQGLWRRRPVIDSPQGPEAVVDGARLVSFCSNDYLGLANHPAVVEAFREGASRYGVGSGASHLVSGHSRPHHQLEEELAAFSGRRRALLFSSGYMANMGVIAALAGKGDSVLEDRLNHASLLDGGLAAGARFRRFTHADAGHLRRLLAPRPSGRTLVVTDGVFSMDGDIAPLPALAAAAKEAGAVLMVDDAHGFGCLGARGEGSLGHFREQGQPLGEDDCPVLVGTLGKAFGTAGAFVAGGEALIETLVQFCRPYIYTTALPPALAQATLASLRLLREEHWRRERLRDYVMRFRVRCQELGFTLSASCTPIQALILGEPETALHASRRLREHGVFVSAIRPPTVPPGTSRLRVTFSAAHEESHFRRLLDALEDIANVLPLRQQAAPVGAGPASDPNRTSASLSVGAGPAGDVPPESATIPAASNSTDPGPEAE